MRVVVPLVCLFLVLPLAGCSNSVPGGPASSATGASLGPGIPGHAATTASGASEVVLHHQKGQLGPEAGGKLAGHVNPQSTGGDLSFDVGKNATALLIELAWPDATSDLDLQLFSPVFCPGTVGTCAVDGYFGDTAGTGTWRNEAGMVGQGDNPARILLRHDDIQRFSCGEPDCSWRAISWAKATAGTTFDLYASVFYGAPMPEGYTAIPPA